MEDIGLPPQVPTSTWSCSSCGTEQLAHCLESAAQLDGPSGRQADESHTI